MEPNVSTGSRTISVQAVARVEGEGSLTIQVREGLVERVELRIFEPPRFYEAFLRNRSAFEVPDITARICGICPVAYQMSSVHALEKIFGVTIPEELRALRRLLYCGEWIESHALHIYMLHAPDFLGYESALAMAGASSELAEVVRRGLRIKKAGNSIVDVLGGRSVHPINIRVGGFYRAPRREEFLALLDDLKRGRDESLETVRWAATLPFPDLVNNDPFVALRHPSDYPMNEGRLVSDQGLDIAQEAFSSHFEEVQVPHSNALHVRRHGDATGSSVVGPLARWALNADHAPALVKEAARATGIPFPTRNPFVGIVVRSLELVLAFDEAIRIIEAYQQPALPSVPVEVRAGIGEAITEAPRGILYHRYETDDEGLIRHATIIAPTGHNQAPMEHDMASIAPGLLHLPEAEAALEAEKVLRNYDPCISCATHFLRFKVEHQ